MKRLLIAAVLLPLAYPADDFIITRSVTAASDKLTIQQQSTNSRQVNIISIRLLCGSAVSSVNVTIDRDGTAASGATELTPIAVASGTTATPRFKAYGASNNTAGTALMSAQPMPCGSWQKVEELDSMVLTRNGTLYNYSIYMTTGAGSTLLSYQLKVRQQ